MDSFQSSRPALPIRQCRIALRQGWVHRRRWWLYHNPYSGAARAGKHARILTIAAQGSARGLAMTDVTRPATGSPSSSPPRTLPVVSNETSQSLCQSCALCCDGTLFGKVPLELAELPPLRELAFDIMEVLEQAHFPQPCAKLVESRCSVYAARPKNCRG